LGSTNTGLGSTGTGTGTTTGGLRGGTTGNMTGTTGGALGGGARTTTGGTGTFGGGPGTGGLQGGRNTLGGGPTGINPQQPGGGANTGAGASLYRESQYIVTPAWTYPAATPLSVRTDLQDAINRGGLRSGANIRVMSDGQKVVLRGRVRDANEARMAEGLLRITPGVRDIVNELQVGGQ